ncbi:MAG: hypothetical protein GY867_01875, partial [bacterium]|nr:hypothetical protein [bacterium]
MAISGDTVIVGAHGEDSVVYNSNRGAAYVFERNQGGTPDNWGQVTKLTASDAQDGDRFGYSVAINGDTVIVGADRGDNSGAAYVFERNQGGTADNWGQVARLAALDVEDGDFFGFSVAISGDTVVVGAYWKDNNSGAAYVFERNQGGTDSWGQVTKLTSSNPVIYAGFGHSVAISDDTIIVGEKERDITEGASLFEGMAYIFERNQGGADNWGQVRRLTASDAEKNDQFGWTVAISGNTAIIGAPFKGGGGIAYVFVGDGDGNQWQEVAIPQAGDIQAGDYFGVAAAISGNVVVVGASEKNGSRGAAYVFERNQGGDDNWGQATKLTPTFGLAENDNFGLSVAISGDTIVVGARGTVENFFPNAGAAYVFERNQGGADKWG